MDWSAPLAQDDPTIWEESYQKHVLHGTVDDGDWVNQWLWSRMTLPEQPYSLFNTPLPIVEAKCFETDVVVHAIARGKDRLVELQVFGSNPYQPDFHGIAEVAPEERRFPSVGNPFIDEPNYKLWERWLLAKLLNEILEAQEGRAFLIDRFRSRFRS